MRQNPIQQKRAAMNVKVRVASPVPLSLAPTIPSVPVVAAPVVELPKPVQSTRAMPTVLWCPVQPVAPAKVPTVPDVAELSGEASDPYALSTLFVALLSGSRRSEIIPLLEAGFTKAKERNDDLYVTIFEGGIAANQPLPDSKRAIAAYHRAFDLCEQRLDAPNGFLHSMVWSLFTTLDDGSEAAELMERARRNLKRTVSTSERNNELLRETWIEFEALPKFTSQVENYRTAQNTESAPVINKLLRESRLDKNKTLLLFPRDWRSRRANDFRLFSSIVSHTCGNYFFWRNGFGTVINPDLSFVDNFYRIGGVLRDLRNIILTTSSTNICSPLTQFRTLLGLLHQANMTQSVRFFVHPDIVTENDAEFRRLEQTGVAESILPLNSGDALELLGGGSMVFRHGSCLLTLPEGKTIQFLDQGAYDLEGNAEGRGDHHDFVILPVDTVEELIWAARLVRERKPKAVVFDLPKENNHLLLLAASVREFIGSKTTIAYADSALVFDVLGEAFVDCVKAFTVSNDDCWSENSRLAFDPEDRQMPEGLLFFATGSECRFANEHSDILEAFLYNRRCRKGLYFAH